MRNDDFACRVARILFWWWWGGEYVHCFSVLRAAPYAGKWIANRQCARPRIIKQSVRICAMRRAIVAGEWFVGLIYTDTRTLSHKPIHHYTHIHIHSCSLFAWVRSTIHRMRSKVTRTALFGLCLYLHICMAARRLHWHDSGLLFVSLSLSILVGFDKHDLRWWSLRWQHVILHVAFEDRRTRKQPLS